MSKRILIVEDEESIADLEKDYLELSGFEVEVANDGEIGLKKGLEGEFDLRSVVRSAARRIHRSLWFQRRKMILIRSVGLDLAQMII